MEWVSSEENGASLIEQVGMNPCLQRMPAGVAGFPSDCSQRACGKLVWPQAPGKDDVCGRQSPLPSLEVGVEGCAPASMSSKVLPYQLIIWC